MTKPAAGRYVIYNRALSGSGEKLALTYPGQEKSPLILTPLDRNSKQIWVLSDYSSDLSYIRPDSVSNTEVGMSSGSPVVLPPGGYVWTLTSSSDGYTIQDGGKTIYWNIAEADDNTKVNPSPYSSE
ncbi:hypothetical protein CC2G_003539 [Coprinopsis cinerea AmutBmut pab1-1]|nr:hypothetical protein CC2G_003539 [Coprinopsis cinerea AmutBmut pab1-1]